MCDLSSYPQSINRSSVFVVITGEIGGGHCPRLSHHPSSAMSAQVRTSTIFTAHVNILQNDKLNLKIANILSSQAWKFWWLNLLKEAVLQQRFYSSGRPEQSRLDLPEPTFYSAFYAQKVSVYRHAHECVRWCPAVAAGCPSGPSSPCGCSLCG